MVQNFVGNIWNTLKWTTLAVNVSIQRALPRYHRKRGCKTFAISLVSGLDIGIGN